MQNHFITEVMDLVKGSFANCVEKLTETHDNVHLWGNWFSFLNLLDELKECWLEEFVDAIIENNVPQSKIVDVYKKCYYKHWIQYIMSTTPKLYGFTRIEQDQNVITFKAKDVLQYKLNKAQIQAELSQKRPNLNMIAGGSEVSIIRREGQKKRRQMPIRKLLSSTCEIIQTIKPCFLMSPLSVSTFLEADKIRFDTVIFDEASQIFPQDALGAIYRGKQVIVVGDSKQMPPSNFFSASLEDDEDDENYDDITDFESILDSRFWIL